MAATKARNGGRPPVSPATVRKVLELRRQNLSGNAIYKQLQGTKWQVSKTKVQDIIRDAAAEPGSDVEPLQQSEGLKAATISAAEVAANLRAQTQAVLTRTALKMALKAEELADSIALDAEPLDLKHRAGAATALIGFALKHGEAAERSKTNGSRSEIDAWYAWMESGGQGGPGGPGAPVDDPTTDEVIYHDDDTEAVE